MSNTMDDLLILRSFREVGRPSKAPSIRPVHWHPPLQGWIKVNTDGAALDLLGDGGCGGAFITCRPFVKCSLLQQRDLTRAENSCEKVFTWA